MTGVGLGRIHETGYMSDARTFYCPTAGETMRPDHYYYISGAVQYDYYRSDAASRLSELKTAGGFDAASLSRGEWPSQNAWWCTATNNYANKGFRVIQGNYNYRNMPAVIPGPGVAGVTRHSVPLKYTKPTVSVEAGCPTFKTQRLLGGRAIVSDSFSKSMPYGGYTFAGMGQEGHREGYNVLYGDWHAKWYGDPQQAIIWWDTPSASGWSWNRSEIAGLDICGVSELQTNPTTSSTYNYYGPGSVSVWHQFDVAEQIDVDAE